MELVKIQIWSPDEVNSLGGFQGFGTSPEVPVAPTRDLQTGFRVSPDYIRDLMVDPQVKAHLESAIEERTKKGLVAILRSFSLEEKDSPLQENLESLTVSELEGELHQLEEGLTRQWSERMAALGVQKETLETAWDKIIQNWSQERSDLLKSHERKWCETLGHVVRKACLTNFQGRLEDLENWLQRNVSEFIENESISIYLSPSEYEALKSQSDNQASKKWTLIQDSQLSPGQIRFEAGNAGVIFDNKKNLEKVLGWIESI